MKAPPVLTKERLVGRTSWYQVCEPAWCFGVAFFALHLNIPELREAIKILLVAMPLLVGDGART